MVTLGSDFGQHPELIDMNFTTDGKKIRFTPASRSFESGTGSLTSLEGYNWTREDDQTQGPFPGLQLQCVQGYA
jgi:hypothetical protein